jgi:trans-aconitate 2-methyltransferase
MWDPGAYLRFGSERARPFFDLISRVQADDPRFVVDLGCGPGNLTAALAARWPAAQVLGVDSSPEMIEAAQAEVAAASGRVEARGAGPDRVEARGAGPGRVEAREAGPGRVEAREAETARGGAPGGAAVPGQATGLEFRLADIRTWRPERPVDVITCNAVLQWVPGHQELLPAWVRWLAPGGWLAFQLPGNFDQPSHTILRELASTPRWRPLLEDAPLNRQAGDPVDYLALLAGAGCEVDAWETTYLHVLHGDDAVVDWYRGSGLRPVLATLPPALAEEFLAGYRDRIRVAYPAAPYGTVLPFRRVFVVARVKA